MDETPMQLVKESNLRGTLRSGAAAESPAVTDAFDLDIRSETPAVMRATASLEQCEAASAAAVNPAAVQGWSIDLYPVGWSELSSRQHKLAWRVVDRLQVTWHYAKGA